MAYWDPLCAYFANKQLKSRVLERTNMAINLGDRVKDKITGVTGIVVCRLEYLNGCTRLAIQPEKLEKGQPLPPEYFDEPQCVLIKAAVHDRLSPETGGDSDRFRV